MLTLDDIGRQSITAFGQAVPSSNLAFYRINKALQPHDFILQGIAHPMHEAYLRHYRHIDPLKPSSCVQSRQPVLSLRQAFDYQPSAHNVRYQHFLARYDIADVVEILRPGLPKQAPMSSSRTSTGNRPGLSPPR